MTKVDETKQYKFSEIVRMVEDGELPVGTKVAPNGAYDYLVVGKGTSLKNMHGITSIELNTNLAFKKTWTIKLPKEDKYYLKAPKEFRDKYLNLNMNSGKYFLSDKSCGDKYQTQFTQSEIDAMPFDTNFFGEPIQVEDE